MRRLVINQCVIQHPMDLIDYLPRGVVECIDESIVISSPISLDLQPNEFDYIVTILSTNGIKHTNHNGYDLTSCYDNTVVTVFKNIKRCDLDTWSLSRNFVITIQLKNGNRHRCNYHGVVNKTEKDIIKHIILESTEGYLIIATKFN